MKYQLVLFDLDGTVTESGPGIMNSAAYALQKFGIQNPDRALLRKFVGPPLHVSFQTFFGLSPEAAKQAVAYYREYYTAGGMFENNVYEGMKEVFQKLKADGTKIYLATSKPQVFSEQIIEHYGLKQYFDGIVGSFLDGGRMDKEEIIEEALRQSGIDREIARTQAAMVGDREYDIIGAHKHGIQSIGVLYGYGSREELEAAGADFIAETTADLLNCFR